MKTKEKPKEKLPVEARPKPILGLPPHQARAEKTARIAPYQFKPGHQAHRPVSSRNRLQGSFLHALADDFDKFGKKTIEAARMLDPVGYIKCVASLMPKQFEQTTMLEELSDAELTAGINYLRSRLAVGVGEGVEPPVESATLN
jgi:hypothetical protein